MVTDGVDGVVVVAVRERSTKTGISVADSTPPSSSS